MPVSKVVCVLMLYSLLVTAHPTDYTEGTDTCLVEFPADGLAQFTGSVPATGSVTILGQSPCPPVIVSNPPTVTLNSDDNIAFKENDEPYTHIYAENYENDSYKEIPKEVIMGALLAGVITAVKGAEINATLAEIDAVVEKELRKIEPLIESGVANADISELDRCVESALAESETQITAEVGVLDDFMESELARTETLVDCNKPQKTTPNIAHEETLKQIELRQLESLVDSLLAKTESVINSELDKVNVLVESGLAKVDEIVKAELEKVDLLVEAELGKIEAGLAKVGSILEKELAKVEIPKKNTECGGPTTQTTITENSEYPRVLTNEKCNANSEYTPESHDDSSITYVDVCGTFPVTGRTVIFGHTGCPPLFPTSEPLPLYVESFPVSTTGICESCDHLLPLPYEDGVMSPMVGPFNNIIHNGESGAVPTTIRTLPAVKLPRNHVPTGEDQDSKTVGTVEFCGTARARGSTRLFNHFPCPPLPTQIGPDGKKYIWIAPSKPTKGSPRHVQPSCQTYPTDCPTTIMDS